MAGAIIQAPAPEEQEYERYLAAIAARQRRADELRAELVVLQAALARFAALCHARVGDLLAELRRVAETAADYERRIERLRAAPVTDESVIDDEEPAPFAQRDDPAPGAKRRRIGPPPRRAPTRRLPAAEAAVAKRLYLDLAKRCHPDYATTDEERRRREAMMQQVNEAYRARDLTTLRALHRRSEADDPGFTARPVQARLAWAREELARLNVLLAELTAEFAALRGTDVHRLWRRHEAGEAVFEEIEDTLEARLAVAGRRLDRLIAAYRRRLDERQTAAAGP